MADIVFFIDHRVRELDSAAAIRRHVKSRHGLEVRVAAISQWNEPAIRSSNPKLVVLPWAQDVEKTNVLRSIINAYPRAAFFNMCWEQLLLGNVVEAKAPSGFYAKQVVYHHSWGPFRTAYLKSLGIPDDRIFENGNPLYTLYQERYRNLYASKTKLAERHGLDADKPWVLFPENYGWAFLTERQIRRRYVSKGVPEDRAMRTFEFQKASLREALRWFSLIDEPIEFILRPRPAITAAGYEAAFQNEGLKPGPSVRIIKDGPICEWIHASDLVVSSFSTTLLEAAVAGKPAFAIQPVPFIADVTGVEWMHQVESIGSFEAFKALLKEPRNLPAADRLGSYAKATAHPCEDALIGAADIMHKIIEMTGERRQKPHYIREPLPEYVKQIERRTREFFGLKRAKQEALEQADVESLTEAEVLARTVQVEALFEPAMA